MKEMQVCSKSVYEVLVAFNNLPSLSEQEEVLDVIYDALHKKVIREVLAGSIITDQEKAIHDLKAEIRDLKAENKDLQAIVKAKKEEIVQQEQVGTRKRWKNAKKGLLIIINNLKHYLGDSWETIFPSGCKNVDAFLQKIDNEGIMHQDTWSRYENIVDEDLNQ